MTRLPRIAIPSFPGSNGEVDNLRTLRRCGFDAFVFRWNDSIETLHGVDGYFLGAGFSYEDRGRSGMVAARDPLLRFLHEESARGAVILGNCNGAQILVESGLVPLDGRLTMALAHNAIRQKDGSWTSPGFLNEWVWITPSCPMGRCATSSWSGALHIPIAHGEGRFTVSDPELLDALAESGQLAFRYCDAKGTPSDTAPITPNGSMLGIAGICNPRGNVVAIMPHPERTTLGDPYFLSVHAWLRQHPPLSSGSAPMTSSHTRKLLIRPPMHDEIFIETLITNNEERTVEQAAKRVQPHLRMRQYRYFGFTVRFAEEYLSSLLRFNPHKERAFVRRQRHFHAWNSDSKTLHLMQESPLKDSITLLRRDIPDTGAEGMAKGTETGIASSCQGVPPSAFENGELSEIFSNPHSSTLEILAA